MREPVRVKGDYGDNQWYSALLIGFVGTGSRPYAVLQNKRGEPFYTKPLHEVRF